MGSVEPRVSSCSYKKNQTETKIKCGFGMYNPRNIGPVDVAVDMSLDNQNRDILSKED